MIWWLAWVILALGQLLIYSLVYKNFLYVIVPDVVISFTAYSGLSIVIWYPLRYFNARSTKLPLLASNIVFTGLVSITIWIIFSKYSLLLLINDSIIYNRYWNVTFPFRLGSGTFIYGMVILTYYLFMSLSDLAEKNAIKTRLESIIRETELKMLRSQINPHFLFNTLNSISSLTVTDPEKARAMVIKLSEFMRYALSRKDEQTVPLRSELENMRLYLDIEKVRFGNRLHYEEQVDKNCLHLKIPVLLLQPLYENAIKFGVHETTGDVSIVTNITCEGEYIQIEIKNNIEGDGNSTHGTGTGLQNVADRIKLYYSGKAFLETKQKENIFTVKLFLPIEDEK